MIASTTRALRRSRHRKAVAAAVLGLALFVIIAHAGTGEGEMGHMAMDLGQDAAMCLAVLGGAIGVILRPSGALDFRARAPRWILAVAHEPLPLSIAPVCSSARDGPPSLQVFRL